MMMIVMTLITSPDNAAVVGVGYGLFPADLRHL
jgi:hypothetical protein